MLSHMDHRMGRKFTAQPSIKSEIAVGRHQVRAVIAGGGIYVIATRWLQTHGHLAEAKHGNGEGLVPTEKEGVLFRPAPAFRDLLA